MARSKFSLKNLVIEPEKVSKESNIEVPWEANYERMHLQDHFRENPELAFAYLRMDALMAPVQGSHAGHIWATYELTQSLLKAYRKLYKEHNKLLKAAYK